MVEFRDNITSSMQVANPQELNELLDQLQQYLPESAMLYGAMQTRKAFKGLSEVYETKIYFNNNSSLVVATPAFSQKGLSSMTIFWDTDVEDEAEIVRLLHTIPGIDWTQPLFVSATPLTVLKKIEEMIVQGAVGDHYLYPHKLSTGHLYSIKEHSLSSDGPGLPDGFKLRPISDKHVEFILSHWKYNFLETSDTYKSLLKVTPSFGIFKSRTIHENNNTHFRAITNLTSYSPENNLYNYQKTTNVISRNHDEKGFKDQSNFGCDSKREENPKEEDNLVAWTILSQFNVFTNTTTIEKYKGRKFATIVTNAMVKRSLQETEISSVCIEDDNLLSVKMHEKIGFVKQHALGFQYFKSFKTKCVVDKNTAFS